VSQTLWVEGINIMGKVRSIKLFGGEIYRIYVVEQPGHFAASLSYYSLFSLIPIFYIAFWFAGIFIDDEVAMQRIFSTVESVLGSEVEELLRYALDNITQAPSDSSSDMTERVISAVAMLFGASLVFFKLQYALNTIWRLPPSGKAQIQKFILNRILAFFMVFCVGVLVIVITQVYVLLCFFDALLPLQLFSPFLNLGTKLLIGTCAIALTLKLVPDARIGWKDAVIGAGVTACFLAAGAIVVGEHIVESKVGSAFEAAGTIAILLVAIYFLAHLFIFGVVFTRVFADVYGSGIHSRNAMTAA
jgi:membrane protein